MQKENNFRKSKTDNDKNQNISEKDRAFTIDKINIENNLNDLGTNQNS